MNDDIRKLLDRASKVGSPLPRKTDLQLFIDFLHEQGTIVNARPYEVEVEGYDVIRFFRPKGGLTQEHFDALAAIDPYASGVLSRAVVERLVIDRGFGVLEVHWAAEGLGYSIWDQVPDEKSFEVAAKEVELEIYRLRAERNKERDGHDESKINPYGDWSVIVVRQGTFALTPLARLVFPVIYRRHVQGLYVTNDYLRKRPGSCREVRPMSPLIGHLGEGRRSGAGAEGVLANSPLSTEKVHEEDIK